VKNSLTAERVAGPGRIRTVVRLADEIWNEHYLSIIGKNQVDYMLGRFQSGPSIAGQLEDGAEYYLLKNGRRYVGYLAIVPDRTDGTMKLDKFYLRKSERGRGFGRIAIGFVEGICRKYGIRRIWLTVNRHNPSVNVYKKLGFRRVCDVVTDIGEGYVMDDYRMEKVLAGISARPSRARQCRAGRAASPRAGRG